jgi:hypothetical protein
METVAQTVLLDTVDRVIEPAEVVEPIEARRTRVAAARPLAFESATRRKPRDGAVLVLVLLFHAAALGTGLWMAWDVARGLAIAERCDGRCVEAAR